MSDNLRIEFLQDNPDFFSVLAEFYKTEWKEYYGSGGQGDAFSEIESFCNKEKLPICLVALRGKVFLGSVALRQKSASHQHLSPWVTSLFVTPQERRKGIGTKLIEAVENLSVDLGFSKIYSRSATAVEFFRKMNWVLFDRIDESNLAILAKDLTH